MAAIITSLFIIKDIAIAAMGSDVLREFLNLNKGN